VSVSGVVLAENRTISLTVPPPAMSPAGHDSVVLVAGAVGVHEAVEVRESLIKRVVLLIATEAENVTLTTTCVAVAPPTPDSFLNSVTETPSCPAVRKCGRTVSVIQLAFVVPVDWVLQMFGLAAWPPLASARSD